eukprot:8767772-Alexandrium_andersonii.AAC.1
MCIRDRMYAALPRRHVQSLAALLTTILATLTIPMEWTNMLAVLIPKVLGAAGLGQFRPIAALCTARKILGYV